MNIRTFHRVLIAAGLLFPLQNGSAQTAAQPVSVYLNQLDFSRYPNVDLYATFVDRNKESVPLSLADSSILEVDHKGIAVSLTDVQSVIELKNRGESELYLAMIFDNSASMEGRSGLLETAATQFIDSLKAGDYVTLLDFGDGAHTTLVPEFPKPVHARSRIPFSNSKPFLRKSVRSSVMTQRTFMYDALLFALSTLNDASALGRKAIILFSDGEDNGSATDLETVQQYVRSYNIPVYAIDLNTRENSVLKDVALTSGGEYFFVKQAADLGSLYQEVLKILKSQYRLTYRSPEAAITGNVYPVTLTMTGRYRGQARKTFVVDGENIGFYNLAYLESIGKEELKNYLDYLSGFPGSKHADQVKLKIGRFWRQRGEYAKSMAVYDMILRNPLSGVYSDVLLEKADLFKAAKQYKAAQQAYNEVLGSQISGSVRARALLELAKTYTAEGNFALALNTYSTLSSQYEGTEMASEAFLQSATLSMEMGDLPSATKNLEQVVTNYGESKSAVYARMELAKIAENEKRDADAIKLYREVLTAPLDTDIKEDITLRLARLLIAGGNMAEGISLYKTLLAETSSVVTRYTCQQELIPALLSTGSIQEARSMYEALTPGGRRDLEVNNPAVRTAIAGVEGTALANGAYVLQPAGSGTPPIATIEWPDAVGKFAVVGPIYSLRGAPSPVAVSIPVEEQRMEHNLIVPGTSGIFHFEKGNWIPMTRTFDADSRSYRFTYSDPGVYALLAKEPRVIRLFNIYFDLGKATIRKEAERNLYEIIDALKALPDVKLEIAGHTDSTGREEENIDLSSRRANAIKDFMVENGIASDRLIARGYGSQYPIAPNDTPDNLQKNRRSEFTIISTIADPTKKTPAETIRYMVLLKSFRSAKDAYEEKKRYQGNDFPVSIVTSDEKGMVRYDLSLGMYDDTAAAQAVVEEFRKEFKNISPTVIELKGARR